jgi:hypothetical protein
MRLTGVGAIVVVLAFAGVADAAGQSAPLRTRSCGTLSLGIGWHVTASPNVTCASARLLIMTYLKRRDNRQATTVPYRYACSRRDLPDAEHIRCVRATRLVTARSFGY